MDFSETMNEEKDDHAHSWGGEPGEVKITRKSKNGEVYQTTVERAVFKASGELMRVVEIDETPILRPDGEQDSGSEDPSPHVWCTVHRSATSHKILRTNAALCQVGGHWVCKECCEQIGQDTFVCHQHAGQYLQVIEANRKELLKSRLMDVFTGLFRPQASMPKKKPQFPRNQGRMEPRSYQQLEGRNQQSAQDHPYQKKR